ncbi:MAG TPA: hypothetical protein VFE58_05875 [Tepidisphaeraceae bacterium]|jgi:hypothetical protein|nr:hypothetical protein [Tepidisphaeraceae bacterium]
MIFVDDIRQVVDLISKETDPIKRSQMTSAFITTAIMATTYYIMVGTVVIVLGRRIINATLKAWKESRREPS